MLKIALQHPKRMNVKVLQDLPKYIPKNKPKMAYSRDLAVMDYRGGLFFG